jgi:ribosome-binding protein aMBF1 (putative translation factor)
MSERDWSALRDRRTAAPGAADPYEAARLAFELGRTVRELRERRGWSQAQLSQAAGLTQSAIARFEAGGTMPTLLMLVRLARSLDASLAIQFQPGAAAA